MSKINILTTLSALVFLTLLISLIFIFQGTKLYSRYVMEHAEKLVSEDMQISPIEASHVYAHVATLYHEVLQREKDPGKAIVASALLIDQVFPNEKNKTTKFLTSQNLDRNLELSDETKIFFENFLAEEKNDKSFILEKSLVEQVPPPPKENSPEQKEAITSLIETTKHLSAEQTAWVNFWSAMHMTPSLAGVWQDRLFTISKSHFLKDNEYAYAQMVLAQSLHDTFKETWIIKEKYLTKRPSHYSQEITLAMEDPQYPSYPSEYSSVGKVASEIIIKFFPHRKNVLLRDQEISSTISQWAGCSFSYDEKAGKLLGEKILSEIESKMNLQAIRENSFLPDFLYSLKTRVNNFTSEAHVYNWGE